MGCNDYITNVIYKSLKIQQPRDPRVIILNLLQVLRIVWQCLESLRASPRCTRNLQQAWTKLPTTLAFYIALTWSKSINSLNSSV